jgi:ribosomal protein S18 acetylase RimI-like enzyme
MSRSIITYRSATLKDADQISSVLIDFYNMKDVSEASEAFISEMEKDFHYIVAVQNDVIVGLVTWLPHGLPKHGLFELDRICLLSEARGKGVGRSLINKLIIDADKWYKSMGESIRKLYLLTHENNVDAHIFYEKVGFDHEVTLKDHYYKHQNERVYSKFFK